MRGDAICGVRGRWDTLTAPAVPVRKLPPPRPKRLLLPLLQLRLPQPSNGQFVLLLNAGCCFCSNRHLFYGVAFGILDAEYVMAVPLSRLSPRASPSIPCRFYLHISSFSLFFAFSTHKMRAQIAFWAKILTFLPSLFQNMCFRFAYLHFFL